MVLDAGTYRAKAVEAALGETKSGKEQVAVKFQLLDAEGLSIVWYGYFTDKTTETTFKALRTAGWKGQDLSDLSDLSKSDTPEVNLVIEQEVGQDGVTRPRVRWVNGTGGIGVKNVLAADKAKAFAARMRGKLAAFDQQTKASAAPAPAKKKAAPAVPQEVLDAQESEQGEDVPF